MKNRLPLITACTMAFAFCALLANAAAKKSPSPSPGPSAAPSPKTAASPKAKPTPTSSPAAKTTADSKLARAIPFHGKISAVDQKANTFTIAGKEHSRVFKITDKTKLTKAGATATMKDVAVNDEVRGSYWKLIDGTLEGKTVKLGPMTDAEKAQHEKKTAPKIDASHTIIPN